MKNKIIDDQIFVPYAKYTRILLDNEMLYNDTPISKNKNFIFDENGRWDDLNENFPLNNYGYRCNNFTNIENTKSIVFAGCSETWGMGLKVSDTWAYKIYKKILGDELNNNFFNLAIPGSSLPTQIISLFKFFRTYGNPTYVFINAPDFFRYYNYSVEKDSLIDAAYDYHSEDVLHLICYQYYFMLEQYCNQNNIKLFSFTWMQDGEILNDDGDSITGYGMKSYPLENFNSFYKIDQKELLSFVADYIEKNKDQPYLEFSRDGGHLGIAYHEYWYNFIYRNFLKEVTINV